MKKQTALLTLLMTAAPAFAVQYSDFDVINTVVNSTSPYEGNFNLLTSGAENDSQAMSGYAGNLGGNGTFSDAGGFQIGTEIYDATVSFWFSDPSGGNRDGYTVSVKLSELLGYEEFSGGGDVSTTFSATLFNADDWADILLTISSTGQLGYKIEASNAQSSFQVDAAMLTVNVPDGGATAGLLGLGFLASAALRRRFSK
jgi:hypothetical protein